MRTVDEVIDALLRPLAYAGIGALVAGDALVPILPSEAGVIAGSAAAGTLAGVALVLVIAWAGAVAGDVMVHAVARRFGSSRLGHWVRRRLPAQSPPPTMSSSRRSTPSSAARLRAAWGR